MLGTRVTFPSRGKSPKARRGCAPSPPEGDASLPLRQAATPSIGLSATTKDRFATLDLWANRSCFFLWFHRGNTFYFQFVARQVGCLRGYRKFYTLATNTARAQGRGIKGGYAPFAGGPGTRRSLAYLSQHLCCYFPLREKVGRGGGAERPKGGSRGCQQGLPAGAASRGCQPRKTPPGEGRERKKGVRRDRPYSNSSSSRRVSSNSSTVSATACGEAMSTPAIRSSSIGWSLDPARKNFL